MKITHKFYVGSNRMSPDWKKETLKEAVDHAKKLLENHPEMEQAIIVKIVSVVRRKPIPFIVERVQ